MEENKIMLSQEEIDQLKKLQNDLNTLLIDLGSITAQHKELDQYKSKVLKKLKKAKTMQNTLGVKLNEKYGAGSIDLTSGEFIPTAKKNIMN